ncbi:hypothetical protein BDA99DRAFT_527523 [Phascolomyces articulosus]|uniref:Bms1-type G domain-containing protein n=1 Tax=Phascolomyces articulosus TaxID=60185 RepID=A0AAD5JMI2_9FUNG|nr:hypothetical protein BDA99DRAFT_527523 [Phascolomyces articulosus]
MGIEQRHRAGRLHQSNKPFKSRHASKGSLKEKSKGKVNRTAIKRSGVKTVGKTDRRNAAKLEQQKKREELTRIHRIFEGRHGAPKIVPVLSLCPDTDVHVAIASLYRSLGQEPPSTPFESSVLNVERFKQKLQFVPLRRNFVDVMDAFKVADMAILLLSADVEVDQFGINCLLGILNQGLVSVTPVVQHLDKVAPKMQASVKKSLVAFNQQFFPNEEHLFTLDNEADSIGVLRYITSQRPKPLAWRDLHPYMLAEDVQYVPSDQDVGTLKVTGFARGNPFNANRLVHLQTFGDFQIEQITSAPNDNNESNDMEEDVQVMDAPIPEEQDDLIAENEPDFMENEQTWPTEEELAAGEEQMRLMGREMDQDVPRADGKVTKRVPKGTSAYQAAWIVDSEDEDYSEDDEDDDMEMAVDNNGDDDVQPAEAEFGSGSHIDEEYEEIEMESKGGYKDELDPEEERRQFEEYMNARQKEFKENTEFPDEIDTPIDLPARERFQRYRGLQSFRTSPWDPYENLPIDYARIFQFENFKRTKARVVTQAIVGNIKPGTRITIWIKNVPKEAYGAYNKQRPYIVFGLLQYEHKMSMLNFQIQRDNAYEEPVKSKDPMVLHVGFRRYSVRPIYSQNTNKGTNHVHKFERFLHLGNSYIATVYGPVMFGKIPCMFYKETENVNEPILVSTGTFMNTDVKRIIAKRIVLSGHPFKIHKRSAVIRYMFFNPEDINYFKPIQLTTKYGRVGHIRESLGTHGYMKCIFDGSITQQDTVLMNLYKRVYPKWNTELWKGALDNSEYSSDKIVTD